MFSLRMKHQCYHFFYLLCSTRLYEHVSLRCRKQFLNQVSFVLNFVGIGHSKFTGIFFKKTTLIRLTTSRTLKNEVYNRRVVYSVLCGVWRRGKVSSEARRKTNG